MDMYIFYMLAYYILILLIFNGGVSTKKNSAHALGLEEERMEKHNVEFWGIPVFVKNIWMDFVC